MFRLNKKVVKGLIQILGQVCLTCHGIRIVNKSTVLTINNRADMSKPTEWSLVCYLLLDALLLDATPNKIPEYLDLSVPVM